MALTDMKGLFQNPAAIRSARIDELIKQQQNLAGQGGSMAGLLGQVASGGSLFGQLMAEGIAQTAGLKTTEEKQAEQASTIMQSVDPNQPTTYFKAAEALKSAGLTKAAFAMMEQGRELASSQKAEQLAEDKFKLDKDQFAQAKTEFKWTQSVDTRRLTLDEAANELSEAQNFVGKNLELPSNVLGNATPDSVAKAANELEALLPLQTVLDPAEFDKRKAAIRKNITPKPSGSTTVTTSLAGLADLFNAEVTERGGRKQAEQAAEAYQALSEKALTGVTTLRTMNTTEAALNAYEAAGGDAGAFSGVQQSLLKIGAGFGMEYPKDVQQLMVQGEFIDWLANKGLAGLAGTFKGSQSEKELRAIQDMTPQKRREPENIRRIVAIMRTESYADQYLYNQARKYRDSSATKSTVGFDAVGAAVDFNVKWDEMTALTQKKVASNINQAESERLNELRQELLVRRGG